MTIPRKYVSIGVSALIVIIALVGVILINKANRTGNAYSAKVDAWTKDQLQPAQAAINGPAFSESMIAGRTETPAELAEQEKRCTTVQSAHSKVSKLSAPKLDPNPYSGLSSEYKSAQALQREVSEKIKKYKGTVLPPLDAVRTYCQRYVEGVKLSIEREQAEKQLSELLDKPGLVTTILEDEGRTTVNITCGSSRGCIPYDPTKRSDYAQQYEKVWVGMLQKYVDLNGGKTCLKELAKVCEYVRTAGPKAVADQEAFVEVIKTSAPDSNGSTLGDDSTRAVASYQQFYEGYYDTVKALFPDVDTNDNKATTNKYKTIVAEYENKAKAKF